MHWQGILRIKKCQIKYGNLNIKVNANNSNCFCKEEFKVEYFKFLHKVIITLSNTDVSFPLVILWRVLCIFFKIFG